MTIDFRKLALIALVLFASGGQAMARSSTAAVNPICQQPPSLYFKWAVCNKLKARTHAQGHRRKLGLKSRHRTRGVRRHAPVRRR